ncbi:hypothetical protein [Amycolatopsis sp. NPDC004079]|uniref:hypothetical protein n=1 Tax=Amycolatopsis sp. NPDC004079 TaxID=3154549 RepID=UPI0033BA7D6C
MTPERLRDAMAEIAEWAPKAAITVDNPNDSDRPFVIAGYATSVMTGEVSLLVRER